jgi:acetylornithine/N-succinyldiaminopimelate aminotransferase
VTAGDFVTKLRQNGLLTLTAGDNVLRILPPLIVGERDIDEALDIMNKVAREWPA